MPGDLRWLVIDGDRTDMLAARHSPMFSDYVRAIWNELDVSGMAA